MVRTESAVMGERGLLILLLAGFCVPAENQIRKHVFVNTLKSWSEAQSYCREKHTDLATVRSQEETQQLLNIAGASLITDAWIGLYRDGTQNWQWSNSEDVIYNWTAKLFCASINSVGQWEDRVCFEKNAFMCYNEPPQIPASHLLFVFIETSTITERYTLIEKEKTWTEAQQYCREHHTDLVSIKNASENEDLVKKAQGKTFWIGLFNEPWKWSHQGDNYTFHYWKTGQPDNYGGNENCVEIMKSGEWNDCGCISQFPFFCYDDPRDTTTVQFDSQSSPTTGPAASQTPDGGEQSQQPSTMDDTSPRASSPSHSSSWLPGTSPAGTGTPVPEDLHLITDSMVWTEAWRYCKNHYTDLVNLTSLAAQNRVSELVRNSTASQFWIGLHRSIVYDNWYWVAGEDNKGPVNYTNWAPGEPNNPYYEHCGEMVLREDGGAEWNDLCCYEKLPFICFKD